MTLDEIIRARHSVRAFENRPVEREKLERILEAGRLAPSARNEQNWRFTAVENPALREKLEAACQGQGFIAAAPVVLVVWAADSRAMKCGQPTSTVNCSIAASFMTLKATELGLGSCWLGFFDAPAVAAALALPEGAEVVAVLPLGYPAGTQNATPRKALDEVADIRE